MSTYDNGGYELDWHVPVARWCSKIFGDDCHDCPEHHPLAMPALDGRGEN